MASIEETIEKFEHDLLSVDRLAARATLAELSKHLELTEISDKIITPALEKIGEKWNAGDAALSQVYMSGIICEELLDTLLPKKKSSQSNSSSIAIVTFEDYHILGKRIVLSVMRASGFEVSDYGSGVQTDDLVEMVKNGGIKILLISTLMFPSALHIRNFREKLESLGLNIKIIVGGAPFRFDETLWKKVGADAMGRTAADAVKLTRKMLKLET
ncbi:cobalamin B12-binding domain-containing protein [Desulfonema magnum]|uniref:Cobalamin-binding domain-containing protein n=1 Tax=Desulfonema magnum TaxID=45655 RepID=A0A975GTP2_9BACT|nr:cobalamin-dependent protein [Desulfonema magnum]QTA93281.1 Cobalamin-binding domain-containing protein [Desulfonema magnum]